MGFHGDKLRELRKKRGMTQTELADAIGTKHASVSDWERGKTTPLVSSIDKLCMILRCKAEYLTDENCEEENIKQGSFVFIPLCDASVIASCGGGNGLYGVDFSARETLPVSCGVFSRYDNTNKPFAMYVEGDSMTGAEIYDGDVVVINPADEVKSSDAALVFYDDRYFVKWIVYKNNGDIELRSANPAYQSVMVEKEYAQMSSWFKIIGKVVQVYRIKKPRAAY